jgi:hypothetical protein
MLVVLLDPGFSGMAGLPNVNLTTFTGYALHTWSPEYHIPILPVNLFPHRLFITLMMEAVCTSETSAYFKTTWH